MVRVQAIAGFVAGRTAGKVFGPAAASRAGLAVVMTIGMVGVGATQSWLGLAGLTASRVRDGRFPRKTAATLITKEGGAVVRKEGFVRVS